MVMLGGLVRAVRALYPRAPTPPSPFVAPLDWPTDIDDGDVSDWRDSGMSEHKADAVAALKREQKRLAKELRVVETTIARLVGEQKPKKRRKKAAAPAAPATTAAAPSTAADAVDKVLEPALKAVRAVKAGKKKAAAAAAPATAPASNINLPPIDPELAEKRRRAEELRKKSAAPPAG